MKQPIYPYLAFEDQADAAQHFYQRIFGGDLEILRMGDTDPTLADPYKQRVMHSVLNSGPLKIYASDTFPNSTTLVGSNVGLTLTFDDLAEMETIYGKLSENGLIKVPLEKQFWGAYYGKLVDQYQVTWNLDFQV
ncbi:VOC family protein [Carnobacterium gallinarum]|uniref:VOC family protein n=1 Tax=Carnobacterium gallinarum TaxID=2749 RepID=UPI000555AEC6|nr:VOC family protein [Carnobacterium gallinarum]